MNTPQIGGGTGARVFKKNKSTEKETSLNLLNNLEKSTPSNWVKDTAFILGDSGLTGLSESSSKLRSFIKGITWRALATTDTFLLSYIVTRELKWASTIALFEILTKAILYYLHERIWNKYYWGRV